MTYTLALNLHQIEELLASIDRTSAEGRESHTLDGERHADILAPIHARLAAMRGHGRATRELRAVEHALKQVGDTVPTWDAPVNRLAVPFEAS
jgi:hypothetical protein